MDSRSLRRRRALAAVALATLAAGTGGGLVWLVHVLFTEGLRVASNWAQLGSLVLAVALVPVGTAIVGWWRRADPSAATASSIYLGTVTLLHCQRRLARQLMRFLDDAHRAGLLRQVGPVYQFRHAKLQDRLAHTYL